MSACTIHTTCSVGVKELCIQNCEHKKREKEGEVTNKER